MTHLKRPKKVHYQCPSCKANYPEYIERPTPFIDTGKIENVKHRPRTCELCGTGLVRRVEK